MGNMGKKLTVLFACLLLLRPGALAAGGEDVEPAPIESVPKYEMDPMDEIMLL